MKSNAPKLSTSVKHLLVGLQNRLVIFLVVSGFKGKNKITRLIRLGSSYGGWHVSSSLLETKGRKVLISVGLGHDVTFDVEMLERGFAVIGLDPLPTSYAYALDALSEFEGRVELINAGIWKECGNVQFYSPIIEGHDSWSITNVQGTKESPKKVFPVLDLVTLSSSSNLFKDSTIRILKLDIEGAEVDLFDSIGKFNPPFNQVSIEMDFLSLITFKQLGRRLREIRRARRALRMLDSKGYQLVNHEKFNFTWLFRDSILP